MEYAERPRSALLAQILQRMQQRQNFQPQSYGALAAGLGAAFLDKRAYVKEQNALAQQEQQQNESLARALQQAQGGPQQIPLGNLDGGVDMLMQTRKPDPSGAVQGLAQSGHPAGQLIAAQQIAQALSGGEGYNLSPGQTRFNSNNQPIASVPAAPKEGKRGIVTLTKGQEVRSLHDDSDEIPVLLEDGWIERSTPLVQIGDTGPQFPAPPQGFYRPDQKSPGLAPEPGSPPPPERQMSGETKAKMGLLNASEESLNEAEGLLFKDGKYRSGLVSQLLNPLRQGAAADLYNSMYEAMSNRLRAESGATITAEEIQNQVDRFLPKVWDSKEVARNKFIRFRAFINQYKTAIQYQPEEETEKKPAIATIKYDRSGNRL